MLHEGDGDSLDDINAPPVGLHNAGNTCYRNAVLQCLTYTRPLADFLADKSCGELGLRVRMRVINLHATISSRLEPPL